MTPSIRMHRMRITHSDVMTSSFRSHCRKLIPTSLALLMLALCALTARAQSTTHLAHAQSLVDQLRTQGEAGLFFDANGVEYNLYGASWADSYILETNPAYAHGMCNNFYVRLMIASYPGWSAKWAGFTNSSPNAAAIHDAIVSNLCHYVQIPNITDWVAGDVLAIKYYEDNISSGHIMILEGLKPTLYYRDGTIKWAVRVIDCSKGPHSQDTRVFPNYTSSGAGRGVLSVYSKNGGVTGYSWSQSAGSTIYAPGVHHLTAGRLTF